MHTQKEQTIIIGGGPGGAAAAMYLARFCHPVLLLDAGQEIRGRTSWAYHLENILGFKGTIQGNDLLKNINQQLEYFGVDCRQETVSEVRKSKDGTFSVKTNKGTHHAPYVVIAVGVIDILPDVTNAEDYFGNSIFPCPACNWYQRKDTVIGVVANDDRGITLARSFQFMQPAEKIYVIPDRPFTHFTSQMSAKAKKEGITILDSQIVCLNGKPPLLSSVTLADGQEIEVSTLFTKLGVKRHDVFLEKVERDEEGYIKVDFTTLESSVENLFAVGPCNTGPDQVMVAAGQGATAGMEIHLRILDKAGI